MKLLDGKLVTNNITVDDLLRESLVNFSIQTENKNMFLALANNTYLLTKEKEKKVIYRTEPINTTYISKVGYEVSEYNNGDYLGKDYCDGCSLYREVYEFDGWHYCLDCYYD